MFSLISVHQTARNRVPKDVKSSQTSARILDLQTVNRQRDSIKIRILQPVKRTKGKVKHSQHRQTYTSIRISEPSCLCCCAGLQCFTFPFVLCSGCKILIFISLCWLAFNRSIWFQYVSNRRNPRPPMRAEIWKMHTNGSVDERY
jgi:hypothetical protein